VPSLESAPRLREEVPSAEERFPRAIFLVMVLVALCVRVIGMMTRGEYLVPPLVGDEAGAIAQHVCEGPGFTSPYDAGGGASPSTLLAPAYPYLLAGLMKASPSQTMIFNGSVYYTAVALNLMFAAALPAVVLAMGQAAGFPRPVSLLAALGMCASAEGFRAPGRIGPEAIFATVTALQMWWMLKRLRGPELPGLRAGAWMGLLSGVVALLDPSMAVALPCGWMLGLRGKGMAWKRVLLHGGVFLAMTVAGSAVWNIRNWFVIEPPAHVFVTGSFWGDTWSALNPVEEVAVKQSVERLAVNPWNGNDPMTREVNGVTKRLTEAEYLQWCRERVLSAAGADPMRMVGHVLGQVDAFWLGEGEARRWGGNPWAWFLVQGVPAVAGVAGVWMGRRGMGRGVAGLMGGILLVYPLPFYVSGATAQVRHPVDALLALGCGWLMWRLLERRRGGA
jgi:hypothetical protein